MQLLLFEDYDDLQLLNPFLAGCKKQIKELMPILLDTQVEDISLAEKRFETGKGYLFTNATGTGKTFVGLGIAKRFYINEKRNILIIVPTDKKCLDWQQEGEHFDLNVYQLNNVSDPGFEISVTTYANFYQNDSILKTNWDLVIYDECHYLNQNEKGYFTSYHNKHIEITNLPSFVKRQLKPLHVFYSKDENGFEVFNKKLFLKMVAEKVNSTKVLFLSATPFAYHKSIKYADGVLFEIDEAIEEKDYSCGYNEPQGFERFLVENFGYRMRYNKCTIPESGVDVNLLERNFFEKYKNLGVMSTRQINLDFDYSREFVTLNSEIGQKIEEGFSLFYDRNFIEKYPFISNRIHKKNNYLFISQLLECIKAKEIPIRIQQHLQLGRKVIVFHNYNNSLPAHPFKFAPDDLIEDWEVGKLADIEKEIIAFRTEYCEFWNMNLSQLTNVRSVIKKHFPNAKEFNGTISKKVRQKNVLEFNKDYSDVNILIVQVKAGQEGISLHDITGNHQRVIINLGLPTQPPQSIQVEGRIYREGLKSNAIYEYCTLQTSTERIAFAQKIAERSKTVENLAMGNLARDLETTFKEGYLSSSSFDPNINQGTGGKESDRFLYNISEFDKAKTFYYQRGKKTAATKAKEGTDYFATPEPLGMKMVEWLNPNPGNDLLEPSAGHGAIARFFPSNTTNHFIEPSYELSSQLAINASGTIHQGNFESYYIGNKFDGIVMNPPFGVGGKLAMEHIAKACKHLRWSGGSVIAIIPNGNSMNSRLDNFFSEKDNNRYRLTAEILLPECTFERAGTKVNCKVIRIQDGYHMGNYLPYVKIDLSHCKSINQFFEEIEFLEI